MTKFRAFLREEERLDELSKTTLGSYIRKSSTQIAHHSAGHASVPKTDKEARAYHSGKVKKRMAGVRKAVAKIKKVDKPKVKPVKPTKVKKFNAGAHGVSGLISRGISSAIKKGVIGVAKKVLR